jgi:predicted sulfurtransferase
MTKPKPITNISTYKFAPMTGLKELRERLLRLCKSLELKGTILLSTEGVNLFIAGPGEAVDTLVAELRSLPGLEDLTPKVSLSEEQPFRRMLVRIKKEIIAFGVESIDPSKYTSRHLPPQELKRWLDEGREVLLFDTRNDYEVKMGTFKGAVPAQVDHFRDFPAAVAKLPEDWKKKPIVTFCTGGIRCEKAAPFMEREGFEQIWQLDGGILKYMSNLAASTGFRSAGRLVPSTKRGCTRFIASWIKTTPRRSAEESTNERSQARGLWECRPGPAQKSARSLPRYR